MGTNFINGQNPLIIIRTHQLISGEQQTFKAKGYDTYCVVCICSHYYKSRQANNNCQIIERSLLYCDYAMVGQIKDIIILEKTSALNNPL